MQNFDDILLEIIEKISLGEEINIEHYCEKYPQYKNKILSKLQTAEFLNKTFQEEDLTGKKLGEYLILKEIARGGMGVVFLGIHPALSRLTAIKVLPPGFIYDKSAVKTFQEEAKTLAKFNHPNIVPIYSISEEKGLYYIAMGYIPGLSLKEIIEKLKNIKDSKPLNAGIIKEMLGEIPTEKHDISQKSISLKRSTDFWDRPYFRFVATIGAEITDALSHAHHNGIYHGDLKPSNILFAREGIPMIVDFGLSKDIKKLVSEKETEFTGTLAYAAPEQIKDNTINDKTDIWSLGVTLYELLTLNNPFLDTSVKRTADKVLKANPLPLRHYNKKIPIEIEAIVLKCLEKNPENRYSSVTDLFKDLNNFLESKPIKAKPIGVIEKTHKWAKRHPVLAGFTIVFFVVIAFSSFLAYSASLNRLINSGRDLQRIGKFEDAEKLYIEVLTRSATIPFKIKTQERALLGLAQINSKDKPNKSFDYYKKCIDINPKNVDALWGIANRHEKLEQYNEAIKYYNRILVINPKDIHNADRCARLLHKIGRTDEALECYKRILTVCPNDSYVIDRYSEFLQKIGRTDEALGFLAEKCKIKQIANDRLIKFQIYELLRESISASKYHTSPIDSHEKAIAFLISKGFDEKYAENIIEKNRASLKFWFPRRPLTQEEKIKFKKTLDSLKKSLSEEPKSNKR